MINQTSAIKKKFSLYWIITAISVLITAVLIWQNSLNKGALIEIVMDNAEGIEAHKTLVKFRSVNVGMVENIRLTDDYSKTIVETRIYPSYTDLLRKDTQFWIEKPRIELKQVTGLSTLLSGSFIHLYLGKNEELSDRFDCLKEPPVIVDEETVTIFFNSKSDKLLDSTTYINYKGMEIGQIEGNTFNMEDKSITYTVKIRKRYASLINSKSVFWIDSGLYMNFGPGGFNFNVPSIDNWMIGSVNVENLGHREPDPLSEGMTFTLYKDEYSAKASVLEDKPKYVIMVNSNIQELVKGSHVVFRNYKVGEVLEVPYFEDSIDLFDPSKPIPVLIVLSDDIKSNSQLKAKKIFDDNLKKNTLCASIGLTNLLLTTGDIIKIEMDPKKKCTSKIKKYRNYDVIPLLEYDSMMDSVHNFALKLGKVDLEGMANNINKSLNNLNSTIVTLNKIVGDIDNKKTVQNLNDTISSYNSDSEMYRSLIGVLNKLNKSISDLEPTIKKLGQKSNALVFSTNDKDVEPKASGKK